MRIAIDFDDTIVKEEYPAIGMVFPFAKIVINEWFDHGHMIIINTCRTGREQGLVEDFMEKEGIAYHYINCNDPKLINYYGKDCRKISADVYIDDKNLLGLPKLPNGDPKWLEIDELIKQKENE